MAAKPKPTSKKPRKAVTKATTKADAKTLASGSNTSQAGKRAKTTRQLNPAKPAAKPNRPAIILREPLDVSFDRPSAKHLPKKPKPKPKKKPLHLKKYLQRWSWPVIITAASIAVLAFAASPLSHPLWGTAVKHSVEVSVLDSEYWLPVPSVTATLDGQPVTPEVSGTKLVFRQVPTGTHTIQVSGDGYRPQFIRFTLGPTSSWDDPANYTLKMEPTSRHIQVSVANIISKLPVENLTVTTAAGTSASIQGKAVLSAPAEATAIEATLAAPGYTSRTVSLAIEPGKNNFSYELTPAGRAYYFSKSDGRTDLHSAALDGSDNKVELAGTNPETYPPYAQRSPDLRWIAFTSNRSHATLAKLFIFDTTTGGVQQVNDDYARYTIIGWTKQNTLVYTLERQTSDFQPANKYQIHRYNPADGSAATVFSNRSLATNTSKNYKRDQEGYVGIYEELLATPILHDDYITYVIRREAKPGYGHLMPPRSYIVVAGLDGKTVRTVRQNTGGYLYPKNLGNGRISYVDYSSGEKYYELDLATGKEELLAKKTEEPITKVRSADNTKVAWAENRGGNNTILVSDLDGQNEKTVAVGFGLTVNCWLGTDYLLLDGSDTAFTMQVVALAGGHPHKIADIAK